MKAMNRDDESEILQRYYNFSNIFPLGGCGGPEKDRVLWSSPRSLLSFPMNSSCQLYILGLDNDLLRMYSTQI